MRPAVAQLIQARTGTWSEERWICSEDLQKFRHKYVKSLLQDEKGELTALEKEVLERRLVEIQEIQVVLINEIRGRK